MIVNIPEPITVFLALASDHITGATGKTLTLQFKKAGGAFFTSAGSPSYTEQGYGFYDVTPDSADIDTEGDFVVRATSATCDPGERIVRVEKDPNIQMALGYVDGFVYVDYDRGIAGTGTIGDPKSTLASAVTVISNNDFGKRIYSNAWGASLDFPSGEDFGMWLLDGNPFWGFNLASIDTQTTSGCIRNANITGDQAVDKQIYFFNCKIKCGLLYAYIYKGTLVQELDIFDSSFVESWGAVFSNDGSNTNYLKIDHTATTALGTASEVVLCNWVGDVLLYDMKNAGAVVNINGMGVVTIDATCVDGTLVASGDITVIDNSGGAVTVTNTSATRITTISTAQLAAMTTADVPLLTSSFIDALNEEALDEMSRYVKYVATKAQQKW